MSENKEAEPAPEKSEPPQAPTTVNIQINIEQPGHGDPSKGTATNDDPIHNRSIDENFSNHPERVERSTNSTGGKDEGETSGGEKDGSNTTNSTGTQMDGKGDGVDSK